MLRNNWTDYSSLTICSTLAGHSIKTGGITFTFSKSDDKEEDNTDKEEPISVGDSNQHSVSIEQQENEEPQTNIQEITRYAYRVNL